MKGLALNYWMPSRNNRKKNRVPKNNGSLFKKENMKGIPFYEGKGFKFQYENPTY
ncbi:hypothetical protein GCM10008986_24280 [Salinibacillus aidingensis]|uniref:Uncharacterized protein n=1 Tax=Salinibacillus aidingensis TaxID=237684 RepID=A0ABN1BEZ3_9BACI